jgi:hypothetical protein
MRLRRGWSLNFEMAQMGLVSDGFVWGSTCKMR